MTGVIEENKEVIDGNSENGFKENAENTSVTEEISNPDVKASDEKNGASEFFTGKYY